MDSNDVPENVTPISDEVLAELKALEDQIETVPPDAVAEEVAASMTPPSFNLILGQGLGSIQQNVLAWRKRGQPGGLKFGVNGAHVLISELLEGATHPQVYLTIAGYAVAAAILAGGMWELELEPEPEPVAADQPEATTEAAPETE